MEKPIFVLVDAYSTGNFLPSSFQKIGASVVHVQTTPELYTSMLPPNLDDYLDNIVYSGGQETCEVLQKWRPIAVIAGQESGVNVADELSELLSLATNGISLSGARRDKYLMIEQLRRVGLNTAKQYKTTRLSDAKAWLLDNNLNRYVVKPLGSASTDGVFICDSIDDLEAAFNYIISSKNIFDKKNDEVLIQSYLSGTEYIVDTVSSYGHHYLCGVWKYEKIDAGNGKRVYDKDVLVSENDPVVKILERYVRSVLDGLDISHGPSHAEVIITSEGPALVEIGARLNGNMHPAFHDVCLGHNQADLIALAYASPFDFVKKYGGKTYSVKQQAIVKNTQTSRSGVIKALNQTAIRQIENLSSVYILSVKYSIGKEVRPTIDLLTSPLRVFLTSETSEILEKDACEIDSLKDEVYTIDD